jgi:hypothetical protein
MSDETPDRSVTLDALALLGAPPEDIAAFPSHPDDLAASFADALVDAPAAVYTDWRFHPSEALNDAWQRLYPHGVKGMIDEEDNESAFPKRIILQHAGIGTRYRIRIKSEEPCLHDIFFALDKVLPADLRIMSLRPYEATDSYLHIIQPAPVFAKVHELLGDWFDKVFASHDSPLAFIKTGGNVKPKRNLVKNWIKQSKQWLAQMQPANDEARSKIELALNCQDITLLAPAYVGATAEQKKKMLAKFVTNFPLARRFYLMGLDMHMYALRVIVEGTIDVLEGRPQGWNRMHLAMQYEVLRQRFSQEMGWDRNIDHVVDEAGRLLALAWALGDKKVVGWLSDELIRFPHNFKGWELTPLEPMLLQLYSLWRNIDINWQNYPKAKLGVYRSLFDAWHDPAKLRLALEMCCDYHCLRTGESGFQEFYNSPFNVLPAEILAVYRLREMQGLTTPTIEHELLETPLGELPAPVQCPPDELLQKIRDAVSREHPEFDW